VPATTVCCYVRVSRIFQKPSQLKMYLYINDLFCIKGVVHNPVDSPSYPRINGGALRRFVRINGGAFTHKRWRSICTCSAYIYFTCSWLRASVDKPLRGVTHNGARLAKPF